MVRLHQVDLVLFSESGCECGEVRKDCKELFGAYVKRFDVRKNRQFKGTSNDSSNTKRFYVRQQSSHS
jgi:hypothetical protein